MADIEREVFDDEDADGAAQAAAEGKGDLDAGTSIEATRKVPMNVQIVLGNSKQTVGQILKLGRGAVIELDRKIGDPVEVVINDTVVARGELVEVAGGRIGVTLTEMVRDYVSAE